MDVTCEQPNINVHLTLFNATIETGMPKKLEHKDIKWITVDENTDYEFCRANKEILEKITKFCKKGL